MARLIPRKQIEEQQNISSSLTIGQNVYVGNDAIISGSLFVSKSFFLGTDTGSISEITGSVFLTGSLSIDGKLKLTSPEAIFSATASNAILSIDTTKYGGVLARDFGANVPTLYVSATDGNDTNDGRSIQFPLRTIKRAAQLATPGYDGRYGLSSSSLYDGYVIRVQAGTYLEDNPVIMPKNSTIWGSGLRITKILAKNKDEDLFWVNSGCYVAEVTVGGLRLWPDQINPQKGFGFAFQPGAFITTSPYIQNCSQISNQENSFAELYEIIPPGGGGLYVNGDVINPDSPLASMVLDAYTQISPNGVGCLVNGRGFIQLVSFFNNFSYYAIRVNNGGHATLNNSNISFGLYGMYASGSRLISGSGGDLVSRNSIRSTWSCIVDVLSKGYPAGLPTASILNTDGGIKVTSESQFFLNSGQTASAFDISAVSADFNLISQIVENGTSNYPTLLAKSSNNGYSINSPYNILGAEQITSSISASQSDLNQISSSFGTILSIFANGTGSYTYKTNTKDTIKVTNLDTIQSVIVASNYVTASVSSSFETVVNNIKTGIASNIISNNSSSIKVSDLQQFTTGESSSLKTINSVSASFSIVYNILANGTGSSILDIPQNHKTSFNVRNVNSSSFDFDNEGSNPTLTLFRGNTYKFYISASEAKGPNTYPFWIRTKPVSGIEDTYDYNIGVINNGDSSGNITFSVPYDAPNELYYVSENSSAMVGKLHIVNSTSTPTYLIQNTLTYPTLIASSSVASNEVDIINAYDQLINNIPLIQAETLAFVSSSWSNVYYNEASCSRDIAYIVSSSAYDLLYGGNEESIRSGLYYYLYPSEATGYEKSATLTAIKYASQLALNLISNKKLEFPNAEKEAVSNCIIDNKEFIQKETIAYLSSSWSGADGFFYNEASCSRDIGYILDAVATDLKYGGNERSVTAAQFYYKYPSAATVAGIPSSTAQLEPTLNGIRYAAGVALNLIQNKTFTTASQTTQTAVGLMRANKTLIQNETIQYINVAYPQLKYNTSKCRRDVGYIVDSISTDLLYGGNERSVTSGRNYYTYPSVATSTQKKETFGAIRYTKIISDYIVQNIILDTPRIVNNTEKGIKVTQYNNVTSSFIGTAYEQSLVSSSFNIVEGIIKRGISKIPSVLSLNNFQNWGLNNPIKITNGNQYTSSITTVGDSDLVEQKWNVVTSIIDGGISAIPTLTSSVDGLIKVTGIEQITGPSASINEATNISSSFALITKIISTNTGSIPEFISNTENNIKVSNIEQITSSIATFTEANIVSSSMKLIADVIANGTSSLPSLIKNTLGNIKVSNVKQYISSSYSGSISDVNFISASIGLVANIIVNGTGSLTASLYSTASTSYHTKAAYGILKENIDFIQAETIAYLSSSWNGFNYNEASCSRDIGLIISGAAEDLLWNTNSASIVSGDYYYLYPSKATDSQLAQTLDGIGYASRIAQKLLQNVKFVNQNSQRINAGTALLNNKELIQKETITYISSSWSGVGGFNYNESSCSRDIGYIIDAIRTDLVYGGNERTRVAAQYYYLFPSQATGSQLVQTIDGINYASKIAQKIVLGTKLVTASLYSLNASNLLELNRGLIAEEVVAYVSSSWSDVYYNQSKCKRDVGYILDAVRTDLVYGGNERTRIAGLYYYLQPSPATVAGVPSAQAQLDPTVTGINYANALSQKIVLGNILTQASTASLNARDLLFKNRTLLKNETIEYISAFYPYLVYNVASCSRDTGFILDGVVTDLVYGGNERSINSGYYYYKFPNKATGDSQKIPTIESVNYAKNIAKKFVQNTIISSSLITLNTDNNVKVTDTNQYTSSINVSTTEISKISSSFSIVTDIIGGGVSLSPTKISNTAEAIKVTNQTPITASISASAIVVDLVTSSFNLVRDIIYYGEDGLPDALAKNYNYGFELVIPNITYSQSSVYVDGAYAQKTASFDGMTNGIYDEFYETGTDYIYPEEWIQMDLGSVAKVNKVVIGADYDTTLGGYYGSSYSTNKDVQYSIDGTNWTTVFNTGTFTQPIQTYDVDINARYIRIVCVGDYLALTEFYALVDNTTIATPNSIPSLLHISSTQQITGSTPSIGPSPYEAFKLTLASVNETYKTIVDIVNNGTGSIPTIIENTSSSINVTGGIVYQAPLASTTTDIEKIGSGFGIVMDIVKGNYPTTIVSNTNSGVKVTDTPQLISGSGAERLQAKLISSSFAVVVDIIANGTGSQTFVSSSTTPNTNQKVQSAYHLLLDNKQMIIDETIAYMSSSWSTFEYTESKCRRDLGYIIDGAAYDLVYNGNSASFVNGKYYYDFPSQANGSQLDQTITALKYASGISEKVVKNIVLTHISASQETSASYTSLINNKQFIQNEVIAYVSSSWSTSSFNYNEASCSRDVAYIVDAVATDLLYGGNERSIVAGDYYFRYPSQATDSQLQPTLDGINYAKGLAMNVAKNTTFNTPNTDTQYSYDLLLANKEFIQNETIAFVNAKYPNLYYDQTKCRRDVGYIIDAAATDLLYGGNQRASIAGEFYFKYPSIATDVQLIETTAAINYAKRLSISVIKSDVIPTPQIIANATASIDAGVISTYNALLENIPFIQSETIAYLSSSWNGFYYNQTSCSRDIGYIVNAVATDLLYGGNEQSANAGITYFTTASNATGTELNQTIDAINFVSGLAANIVKNKTFVTASQSVSASVELLRNNRGFIQNETMAWLDSAWSFFDYNKVSCSRDLGYIIDGVATDLLYGGNERTVMSGEFYFKYPSKATLLGDGDSSGQLGQTRDGILYASRIAQKVAENIVFQTASLDASASADLLRKNKTFISAETIAYVSSSWSGVKYNEASCSRDVRYILDAAATDVLYGGQERSVMAGSYYFLFPSKATVAGVPSESNQLDPTITGIKYAGRLATKVITNPIFQYASQSAIYGNKLLAGNRKFLQKETIAFLSSSWSTLQYNEASCSRDVGFIVDAVATDLLYGGNERAVQAGSYYYYIPSVAIADSYTDNGKVGQKKQTVDGVNFVGGMADKLIIQQQLLQPTAKKKAAAKRLIDSKEILKYSAIAYTNGAFPYLVYNEASCSRDTGLIVDACVTDLLYGGNERGIAAASSYYTGQYGSAIAVTRDQLLETLETNRYLRTKAEFIAANAPLESFGSLIVATGIDFSYNGAGVTFKALPPNQGGTGVPNPDYYITELGGGRIYFTSGDQNGNFNIGTGLTINQATGTLVGRTFNKSLFALVTPYSLALQI
jgi:hypothetical protein